MKKIYLCLFILSSIFFNGCFNYVDIDKLIFATTVIVDIDEQDNPVVYVETFKSSRGGQGSVSKGQRVLFKGNGKTIFEALRDINLSSSYRINYTQMKNVIFTQKVAEKGLDKVIDLFDRGQELVVRAEIIIFKGDPSALLGVKLKEQEYIGLFIHDVSRNISVSSRGIKVTINDFINKSYGQNGVCLVPMIALKKEQMEDKIEIDNIAVIKNYKIIDQIKRNEGEAYNFLIDNIHGGSMEVSNPEYPDNFISLEILNNKTDSKIYYDGNVIHVKKLINTRTNITEVQKGINLTKKTIYEIEKNAEANIKKNCSKLFDEYKNKKLDIFDVTEDFHRKYPKENIENIISKCKLEIEPHVIVEGSTDITSFR